jgi:hypothetical protein
MDHAIASGTAVRPGVMIRAFDCERWYFVRCIDVRGLDGTHDGWGLE